MALSSPTRVCNPRRSLFAALTLYCIVGFSIQKFGREKEGTDVVPNYEFWVALPGLAWVRLCVCVCVLCVVQGT